MSKIKKAFFIRKEIKKLNEKIDRKIVRGLSYQEDARRHRFLMDQRAALLKSFFSKKPFGFVATFLL